ncbi:hypothetical protein N9868_01825 [Akkermansiaceae bacterium]|nr:hypothetical protein [Akkermansiaceae bacterium]MDB4290365.1 hypothetical protein [bacterium]MDB4268142.1 hypothetical protein [Akkermansiaceae bacterium]MDB4297913.1 hypothetical protein [bacterium]MDB4314311.1 hypothetical protein [Akkermansiaceae bacterium]
MIPHRTHARRALITGLLSFFLLLTQASAEKKGVNFVLSKGDDPTAKVTLKLNDVPLGTVLKYVSGAAELRARIDAHAVTLLPSEKK